jgi:hypothetical protein
MMLNEKGLFRRCRSEDPEVLLTNTTVQLTDPPNQSSTLLFVSLVEFSHVSDPAVACKVVACIAVESAIKRGPE